MAKKALKHVMKIINVNTIFDVCYKKNFYLMTQQIDSFFFILDNINYYIIIIVRIGITYPHEVDKMK